MIRKILTGLTLSALLAVGWWINKTAWERGYSTSQAEYAEAVEQLQARLDVAADLSRIATQAMLRERRTREDLQRSLSNEARQDPDADRPALGAGSVRRLNQAR